MKVGHLDISKTLAQRMWDAREQMDDKYRSLEEQAGKALLTTFWRERSQKPRPESNIVLTLHVEED